jgi:hypothetical protein
MTYNQGRQTRFTQTMVFVDFLVKQFAVTWLFPSNTAEPEHLLASLSQTPDSVVLPRVQVFRDVTLRHWVNVSQYCQET